MESYRQRSPPSPHQLKMAVVWILISVAGLMSGVGRACDGNHQDDPIISAARQQSAEYLADAYGFDARDPLWNSYDNFQASNRVPVQRNILFHYFPS